jgi:hypothetical protein
MEQSEIYGQMDFNLPHDVVNLPTKGIFYKPKKESLKVGYLTATDENILMSPNSLKDGIVTSLLKNKVYEPGFDVNQLLEVDARVILIFLRNTSFGTEYNYELTDPLTNKRFEITITLENISYEEPKVKPNELGLFEFVLPKSNKKVLLKLLSLGDISDLDKIKDSYPNGMVAPTITKTLEKHIIEIDGNRDREYISSFISRLPIADSKSIRKFIKDCEPSLDLKKTVIAPSGEKVTFEVAFGVEFFRPFFTV